MKKFRIRGRHVPSVWKKCFRLMKLTFLFLLMGLMQVSASVYGQTTKLTIDMQNARVVDVLEQIEKQSEFRFAYSSELIDMNRIVTVRINKQNIEQTLKAVFEGSGVVFVAHDRHIMLYPKELEGTRSVSDRLDGQQKTISGKVTDTRGLPLPGVTVLVKGTTQGTVTDFDGNYSLTNIPVGATLQFSFVGMKSQEMVVGNQTNINVVLQEETIGIEEVIAVGYGTQKKRDIIGSVASISSEDISKTAPVTIESTLQGMAAGVQVNSGAGLPGAPQQIKIRGISSISSGTDPLWIIDGIPVQSGTMDKSFNGETSQSILSMFNPNDIESIQILKDAAATSIYGSRGSNGVILVTTKTGKKGQTRVDVDMKTGVSNWAKTDVGYANNKEYISIMDMGFRDSGATEYNVPNISAALDGATQTMTREEALATNTNWADEISQTGTFYEANAAVSQGSENGNFYISLKYRSEEGNLKYSQMETFSANANLNYNLLNCFDLGYRLFASSTDNDRIKSGDGKAGAGGWAQINSNSLPWMKVYDQAGMNGYWNSLASVNALATIDPVNAQSNLKTVNIISALTGVLHLPVKGLSLKGEYGLNFVTNRARSWRSDALLVNGAVAEEIKYESKVINYNAYFNYDVPLGPDHVLNMVAGIENTRNSSHFMNMRGEGLVGVYPEVGTPNTLTGNTGIGGESYLRGYFGRANYKMFDKYLVGASIRRDGISRFTPENRWATFMSGSFGWIISEEKFFAVKPISLLKLRGSFGQTGNTNIPSGITTDSWSITSGTNTLEGNNNTVLESIGNSDIKWETTNSLDFGIDFGLFSNRVNGWLAINEQKVSERLFAVTLPPSAGIRGGNSFWQNICDMKNMGVEFNMDAVLLNKKDFTWSAGFNISTNKNEVLALDAESDAKGVGILQEGEGGVVRTITKTGLAYATWYLAEYAGVDAQKGIPMIYQVETLDDGSTRHTGNIIPATVENITNNRMILEGKTALPKVLGGFNTSAKYKNFDFSMVWSFVTGNYIYSRLYQSAMTPNAGMLVLNKKLLTDTWAKPGDETYWPQVVAGNLYYYDNQGNPTTTGVSYSSDNKTPSSQYLQKGDYLKLRNVTLGYTLPQHLTQKYKLNNVRVYVSGNNLLMFTKFLDYDPEIPVDQESGGSYSTFTSMPASRIFMCGLSVNF